MSHLYPAPTKFLWKLSFPDFSSGTDQVFTNTFTGSPPVDSRSGLYVITGVFMPSWPGTSGITGIPTGGIFDQPSGGGNAIVLSTQVWSNSTPNLFVPKLNSAICPDPYVGGSGVLFNVSTATLRLFLNVTGSGTVGAIYICGYDISALF